MPDEPDESGEVPHQRATHARPAGPLQKLVKLMGGSRFNRFMPRMLGCEDGITHVLAGGWA